MSWQMFCCCFWMLWMLSHEYGMFWEREKKNCFHESRKQTINLCSVRVVKRCLLGFFFYFAYCECIYQYQYESIFIFTHPNPIFFSWVINLKNSKILNQFINQSKYLSLIFHHHHHHDNFDCFFPFVLFLFVICSHCLFFVLV